MKIFFLFLFFFSFELKADPLATLPFNPKGSNRAGYIKISPDRPIDQSTYLEVKFALEHFKTVGISFIVLDLNTPGGEIFAAMHIADLLHKIDLYDHIPVVAWIDNWAISAGAMLAYSCRYIGIVPTASMGAAEPVTVGSDGKMETASEKVNSALRAEMVNLANLYGRDPLIAEAMVDKDLIVVKRNEQIIKLGEENEIQEGDLIISGKGKLLTLNAKELLAYGVADFESDNPLLETPFFAEIPHLELIPYKNWKVDFFSFLSHPSVASLLMGVMLLCGYLEFNHPGLIIPGAIAGLCLGLILLSHFSIQTIGFLEPLIFFLGLGLLLVELFVLPGFGVIGIFGAALMLFGLFTLTVPFWHEMHFSLNPHLASGILVERIAYFSLTLLVLLLLFLFFGRPLFHRFLSKNRLILTDQESAVHEESLIGTRAVAMTELRPSGKIQIATHLYDALSDREFIEKGALLLVVRHEGQKIVVKKI